MPKPFLALIVSTKEEMHNRNKYGGILNKGQIAAIRSLSTYSKRSFTFENDRQDGYSGTGIWIDKEDITLLVARG